MDEFAPNSPHVEVFMDRLRQATNLHDCTGEDKQMKSFLVDGQNYDGSGALLWATVSPRQHSASSPVHPVSQLPDEIWLLVLAWSGLRTSAVAATCSSTFHSFHHTVASTPTLLARALLVDHGLTVAAANLYGSSVGHPNDRHAVHCDPGIAATLCNLLVLSAPPGTAAAAAAAYSTYTTAAVEIAIAAAGAGANGAADGGTDSEDLIRIPVVAPQAFIAWGNGGAPAFYQLVSGLLCAAACVDHVQMAATTLVLGALELDRALIEASTAGHGRIVRLLLASGADPNAAGPFGHCALYEAAKNGRNEVVEVLLDAGARMDGAVAATNLAMSYGGGLPSVPQPLSAGRLNISAPTPFGVWRLWPSVGGGATVNGPEDLAAKEPRGYPTPLRVPIPVAAGSAAHATLSLNGAAASVGTPANEFDVQGFFSDSSSSGTGTLASPVRSLDEHPKTPTATAAASAMKWDEEDELDQDHDGDKGNGPSIPFTPVGPVITSRCLPQLPRRKPSLPLPADRSSLPLMPSLTFPPPLPPPMMLLLAGDRGPQSHRGGPSPLMGACQGGHAATAALLLRRGAKVDTETGAELLAASHPQVIDELMAAVPGLSVHLGPALLAAASANRSEVISALLRHGADSTFRGGMALQEAAFRSHLEVIEVLLAADRTRLEACGAVAAALNLAGCFRRVEVVKLLQGYASEM